MEVISSNDFQKIVKNINSDIENSSRHVNQTTSTQFQIHSRK